VVLFELADSAGVDSVLTGSVLEDSEVGFVVELDSLLVELSVELELSVDELSLEELSLELELSEELLESVLVGSFSGVWVGVAGVTGVSAGFSSEDELESDDEDSLLVEEESVEVGSDVLLSLELEESVEVGSELELLSLDEESDEVELLLDESVGTSGVVGVVSGVVGAVSGLVGSEVLFSLELEESVEVGSEVLLSLELEESVEVGSEVLLLSVDEESELELLSLEELSLVGVSVGTSGGLAGVVSGVVTGAVS